MSTSDLAAHINKLMDMGIEEDDGVLVDELITASCRPNYAKFEELAEFGFSVGPGERDSFGWLSGVVTRKSDGAAVIFG